MFLLRLPFLPVRVAFFLGRLLGYSRVGYLLVGVLIGLFCAPVTGREMRERVRVRLDSGSAAPSAAG